MTVVSRALAVNSDCRLPDPFRLSNRSLVGAEIRTIVRFNVTEPKRRTLGSHSGMVAFALLVVLG